MKWQTRCQRSCWIILFLLFGVAWQSYSQRITDVRFEQFGNAIRVHYTLSRLPFDSFAALNLYVSTNGGVNFAGPLIQVQGDIGKVGSNGDKSVIWQVMKEQGSLDGQVVFEFRGEIIKEKLQAENLLMYNASGSSYAGLMYGRVARWGGYVRGKTNFSFANAPYTCNNLGVFNYKGEDDYYVVDQASRRSRLGLTAGVLYRPLGFLYLYAGAGYGYRRLMWHAETLAYSNEQPVGELWAVNNQCSAEGVEAELGGIFRYKRLAVSLGVNTVDFSFVEVNGAIGFFF